MNTRPILPSSDASHLNSHDVIFEGSLPDWTCGVPLGGADTAVVAFQVGNRLCYGITRAGFVDTRSDVNIMTDVTHAHVEGFWRERCFDKLSEWDRQENAHYMNVPYPNPRPIGILSF
jgi:hypothetical protein